MLVRNKMEIGDLPVLVKQMKKLGLRDAKDLIQSQIYGQLRLEPMSV